MDIRELLATSGPAGREHCVTGGLRPSLSHRAQRVGFVALSVVGGAGVQRRVAERVVARPLLLTLLLCADGVVKLVQLDVHPLQGLLLLARQGAVGGCIQQRLLGVPHLGTPVVQHLAHSQCLLID
jgi:hypothetical protein